MEAEISLSNPPMEARECCRATMVNRQVQIPDMTSLELLEKVMLELVVLINLTEDTMMLISSASNLSLNQTPQRGLSRPVEFGRTRY